MRTVKDYITNIEKKVIEIDEIVKKLKLDFEEIKINLKLLVDIQMGNWEITDTQMIFYDLEGNEIMRFNLYNRLGNKTNKNVTKRVKI